MRMMVANANNLSAASNNLSAAAPASPPSASSPTTAPPPLQQPSPTGALSSSSASPTNTSGSSDGSVMSGVDLAALMASAASAISVKSEPFSQPPQEPPVLMSPLPIVNGSLMDSGMLLQMLTHQHSFMQQALTARMMQQQAAAASATPPQTQTQTQERKRSYPCTFQFCVICQKDVHSSKLPCHIRQCHVAKPMFQCPACDFTSTYSKNNVKSHMVSLHGLAGDPISFMDQYAPQVEEFMKMCFPNVRGRGRPMQGRGSPRSPGSPLMRRHQGASTSAAPGRRPSFMREDNAMIQMAQQQQHAAMMAQAQSLNAAPIFQLFNNNNNNNNHNKNNNNANLNNLSAVLGLTAQASEATRSIKSESGESVDNGVSSSAFSNDDTAAAERRDAISSECESTFSYRVGATASDVLVPVECVQPRYQPVDMNWSLISRHQPTLTIFSGLCEGLSQVYESLPAASPLLCVSGPLLSPEQTARVASVRQQITVHDFSVFHTISRLVSGALSPDLLQLISSIAPSPLDVARIRHLRSANPNCALTPDEQFIEKLAEIDFLEEKLSILLFQSTYETEMADVCATIRCLAEAERQVRESDSLRKLLQLILALQNRMAFGQLEQPQIGGFVISKLSEMMSFVDPSSGVSVLEMLATAIRDGQSDVSAVFEIIPQLAQAGQASLSSLFSSVSRLESGASRIQQSLQLVQLSADPSELEQLRVFVEGTKEQRKEARENAVATKNSLISLMFFLAEPLPLPVESFQPETFFRKLASFLEQLKAQVEQVDV